MSQTDTQIAASISTDLKQLGFTDAEIAAAQMIALATLPGIQAISKDAAAMFECDRIRAYELFWYINLRAVRDLQESEAVK